MSNAFRVRTTMTEGFVHAAHGPLVRARAARDDASNATHAPSRLPYRPATMKRLRVMHVAVAGDIGGAERLLVDLAARPDRTGADHEVALITPNRTLAAH